MYDRREVVYVGKAVNLRHRLMTHITGSSTANVFRTIVEDTNTPMPARTFKDPVYGYPAFEPISPAWNLVCEALMSCFSFRVISTHRDRIRSVERRLIRTHNPRYNY
jgi:excinuclease UvrABC nuclease subunit